MKVSERYTWIDCIKGIGIFLVVLGHIYKDNYIGLWIYSFHMPLFFMLSGYLMYAKSVDWKCGGASYLTRKSKTLLWPFILFRVLLVGYWYVVESKFRELDLGPIWFLLVLYLVEVITFPIVSQFRKLKGLLLFVFSFSLLFLGAREYTSFGWLLMWCNASVWFVIGMLLKCIEGKYVKGYSKNICIVLCLLFVGVGAFAPMLNGNVSIFSSVTNNFLLYLFFGIIGTMLIGIVCKMFIVNNKVIEYCGIYSIIILAIHEPIKRILMKAIMMGGEKIGFVITKDSFSENYLLGMLLCLIVMACCVPVITMLRGFKRYMGKIGAFVFGFVK